MVATWTPTVSPGEKLFELSELDGPIAYTFSAESTLGSVTNYGYELDPPAALLDFVINGSGVHMSAASLLGLFPIQWVDYMLNGVISRVTDWGNVPAEAEQIIGFLPNTIEYQDFNLTVTAEEAGEPIQNVWTFRIIPDWTAGRDKLIAEVNARNM